MVLEDEVLVVVLERLEVRSSDPPRTIEGTIVDVHPLFDRFVSGSRVCPVPG